MAILQAPCYLRTPHLPRQAKLSYHSNPHLLHFAVNQEKILKSIAKKRYLMTSVILEVHYFDSVTSKQM